MRKHYPSGNVEDAHVYVLAPLLEHALKQYDDNLTRENVFCLAKNLMELARLLLFDGCQNWLV
jgi:hypothetical protein